MSGDVIDKEALRRLLNVIGGDPEDLAELLQDFEETTPKTLASMEEAAQAGDLDALRISAHSLKSNGRDFGAIALAKTCEALEHACKKGAVGDPVARVAEISAELRRAREALEGVAL